MTKLGTNNLAFIEIIDAVPNEVEGNIEGLGNAING
jgi:hypothetical protein